MTEAQKKELDEDWADFLVGIERRKIRSSWIAAMSCFAAAVLACIVVTFPRNRVAGEEIRSVAMISSLEKNLLLPDGTKVSLSSGSRLYYPESFSGDTREVKLDGEAYFEVKSSPERPFLVHVDGGVIKVTGTKFTASSFDGESELRVSLDEGKVELSIDGQETINMLPSQEVRFNRNDNVIMDTHLVFKDCRLEDIMNSVSTIYGVQVDFRREELRDVKLSFRIPQYGDASALVTLIGIVCKTATSLENGIISIG